MPQTSRTKRFRSGRWTILEPPGPQYLDFVYHFATREPSLARQLSGPLPGREEVLRRLADDALVQFIVLMASTRRPIGIVRAYRAQIPNGHAFVGGAMVPELRGTGIGSEAFLLFVAYLFSTWNLRKVYVEIPEYQLGAIRNHVGGVLVQEGRLRAHHYYDQQRWDQLLFAIYRDRFLELQRAIASAGWERAFPGEEVQSIGSPPQRSMSLQDLTRSDTLLP
jgi:RimJ/RimL family protein N-acetyltransferase